MSTAHKGKGFQRRLIALMIPRIRPLSADDRLKGALVASERSLRFTALWLYPLGKSAISIGHTPLKRESALFDIRLSISTLCPCHHSLSSCLIRRGNAV